MNPATAADNVPTPLLQKGQPATWWFVFKFNAATFPECGGTERSCPFGGSVRRVNYPFSQQFVYASSRHPGIQRGKGCLGDTTVDPVGATFDEIYNGHFNYVVWNDQFYGDPPIKGCSDSCGGSWGHSKGILAWNNSGEGLVIQVSTPSWPASGSAAFPRKKDGNSLGCVIDDDVKVSQHFFALKLTKSDVLDVLRALQNSSVVTDVNNPQIVHNGGPSDIKEIVAVLGRRSKNKVATIKILSSGIKLISKPSRLHVPPWQMVSSMLGSAPLLTATWWTAPAIPSTDAGTKISCWDESLGSPGPVTISITGHWLDRDIGLAGGPGSNRNHAKIGTSAQEDRHYSIFGDMNQQGALSGNCASSQNGRGGIFYVVENSSLSHDLKSLLLANTASLPNNQQQ